MDVADEGVAIVAHQQGPAPLVGAGEAALDQPDDLREFEEDAAGLGLDLVQDPGEREAVAGVGSRRRGDLTGILDRAD
jgi:hypothetical protein